MKPQNWEKKREQLVARFEQTITSDPSLSGEEIRLSWSNWGFGNEALETTAKRLHKHGVKWIELHGNRYTNDLGYNGKKAKKILESYEMKVAGICGMFGPENDLSSTSHIVRQNAIDYIRRQLQLCIDVGGSYILIVPGAVGRPHPYDEHEFDRSMETLSIVADEFVEMGVRALIEPIRSEEVSFIHTVADAKRYIAAINHPAIRYINGDVFHMQAEEANIAEAILEADEMLINLHLADSNRRALGGGTMDVDAIIMALYVIGYTRGARYATPEPLGPGGDPYRAMHGMTSESELDKLVGDTVAYWREREAQVKTLGG